MLSGEVTDMHTVMDFVLSPDSTTAVYWVGFSEAGNHPDAIYAVPVAGGPPIDITGSVAEGWELYEIQISADSDWLFYSLINLVQGKRILYRVPLDGSAEPSALSPDVPCQSLKFVLMPTGHGVVYARVKAALSGSELVHVNDAGIARTLVEIAGTFKDGRISPDGLGVLYVKDLHAVSNDQLIAVNIANPTIVKVISGSLGPTADVVDFKISTDSKVVVFKADRK